MIRSAAQLIIVFLTKLGRPFFYLFLHSFIAIYTLLKLIKVLIDKFYRFIKLKHQQFSPPKIKWPLLSFHKSAKLIFSLLLILTITGFSFYFFILKDLPQPEKLITRKIQQTTKIYDRHHQLLYKIYRQQNRTLIPIEAIPQNVKQATIAIEDGQFYHHRGLSLSGISRALWRLISSQKIEGGSTITQQLVKNALLSPERTVSRKIKEAILAIMVENHFSKKQILQMYLNEVGYGGATYGIEEASQYYFAKSAPKLDLAEAALLAGLPASPTTYSPFGPYPQLAKKRQEDVLDQMQKKGIITSREAKKAKNKELKFAPIRENIQAPHFVMFVKEKLVAMFGQPYIEEGGLEVITTLDLNIQRLAQKAVQNELDKLRNQNVTNGAALITKPNTGEILAMVGSRNYFDQENQGNFNVTTAQRQPGSAIKVINYALALQNSYTLASQISDTAITYQIPGQTPYSPHNYDHRFHGNVTLRTALACSYNVPAVKVLASLGVSQMVAMGQKMGITTWNEPNQFGLALTLGAGETKMTDLAVVYGTLANEGKKTILQSIVAINTQQGKNLWTNPCLTNSSSTQKEVSSCQKQALSPEIAFLLTSILADNQARTPAFGVNSILDFNDYQVAVKTGTSNNLRDNWAIGYTPNFLVAAWVGNNNNTPMGNVASGLTGASPIWRQITEKLLAQYPSQPFSPPKNIVQKSVCLKFNQEEQKCLQTRQEYFIKGTGPLAPSQIKIAESSRSKLLPAIKIEKNN